MLKGQCTVGSTMNLKAPTKKNYIDFTMCQLQVPLQCTKQSA